MSDLAQGVSHAAVRESITVAKTHLEAAAEQIVWQIQNEAWFVLGYADWDEMREAEYGGAAVMVPREHQPELVAALRREDFSQQQVADTIGVSQKTVSNIISKSTNDAQPQTITNARGQERPASYKSRAPDPPPDPWTEEQKTLRKRVEAGETVVATLRGTHNTLIAWADAQGLFTRIDRRTPWGNPFEVDADGDRDTVIRNYADHYLPHKPSLLGRLDEIRGHVLGCWCAPEPCHGDVLKERAA